MQNEVELAKPVKRLGLPGEVTIMRGHLAAERNGHEKEKMELRYELCLQQARAEKAEAHCKAEFVRAEKAEARLRCGFGGCTEPSVICQHHLTDRINDMAKRKDMDAEARIAELEKEAKKK